MKNKTQTAIAKDIKTALNATEKHANVAESAAEKARLYAATGREHAERTDNNLADTTLYSDKAREAATRAKVYAQNADDHARRAELNAEDAATYAHTARTCLLLTIIFNALFLTILYCIR